METPVAGAGPAQDRREAWGVVRSIFRSWRDGRPGDMQPLLHADMVMVFPGNGERAEGADAVMAGFIAFCAEAVAERVEAHDRQLDVVGHTAVASYAYAMTYVRGGRRFRASGRDQWVLEKAQGAWLAVWRTMLELEERELT
jgi:ketosteroid isomerase-like protein